ncbi:carbohydrate ABC transporter substrate-binding protein, CUT1 family (TC 3.A.1.1.-) [Nocardioides terrae]|uniref:Carbohydrate ABC transporter substrate-binding protein, CUT1 family (TC 3.A.1.1.-) n=1 Tax=Nocardioides terrae TaxID=574651 RepID=A0A1I1L1G8_9ACTN|nr:extracellular solute-binding protein [Nocardioides terrae]SFC66884.1 carbohydrate ABC transporter substrate-binding protein, CUT1 family (TC 3.A.1.1.-) [Nocardioides terrae]
MARKTRGAAALAALCAGVLLTTAACGGSDSSNDGGSSGGKTTVTWWHNSNETDKVTGGGKAYYEQVAADYEKAHPDVDIKISAMAHEDMLTKLDAAMQSGDMPDIYMERGGGELVSHVEAGITKDISDDAADVISNLGASVAGWQVDGKTYGLPFSMGVVGFWYNKDLFAQAGITAAPTTLDEWLTDVDKLKAADIVPVSVGVKDKWPAGHWWYYTVLRSCSQDTLQSAVKSLDFSDPCFVKGGEVLKQIVDAKPFNQGFLSTPGQTGTNGASSLLATGKAAMELAGHWEPGVMAGLVKDGTGLSGDKLGWFPFPAVDGGAGDPGAQLGGGDAWAVSKDAPEAAVDFVKYLLSDEVQTGFAAKNMGLPTNPAAGSAVKDPAMAQLLQVRDSAPFIQLYFDTAFGTNVGNAMNDAIVNLFAGQATPQQVVDATQKAADQE